MKVWITKYALTKGIFEAEVEPATDNPGLVGVRNGGFQYHYFHRPHWHESREAAVQQAKKMKLEKLSSLRKQLERIENLDFNE